jgi:biotin synthase
MTSIAPKIAAQNLDSPEMVRLSLAAAMTLGFVKGWFFRNARLRCVNLLLTYSEGCMANCAFCGLARSNIDNKKFIRVAWKPYRTEEVIERLKTAPDHVKRVCVSMITNNRCKGDVIQILKSIRKSVELPVSLLITPGLLEKDDLIEMRDSGAERVGIAIDAATEPIFHKLRGKGVKGPHKWDKYWRIYEEALEVFGAGMAGVHLICGLGETEYELVQTMQRARDMGGFTHLFSFFPEKGSAMAHVASPPISTYRRIQLARYLMDNDLKRAEDFTFDNSSRIRDFGLSAAEYQRIMAKGEAFETSGCPGEDGKTACNRPYGNEKPGESIRNFPFEPELHDLEKIREELIDLGH